MNQCFPISTRLDEHVENLLTQFVAIGFTPEDSFTDQIGPQFFLGGRRGRESDQSQFIDLFGIGRSQGEVFGNQLGGLLEVARTSCHLGSIQKARGQSLNLESMQEVDADGQHHKSQAGQGKRPEIHATRRVG